VRPEEIVARRMQPIERYRIGREHVSGDASAAVGSNRNGKFALAHTPVFLQKSAEVIGRKGVRLRSCAQERRTERVCQRQTFFWIEKKGVYPCCDGKSPQSPVKNGDKCVSVVHVMERTGA